MQIWPKSLENSLADPQINNTDSLRVAVSGSAVVPSVEHGMIAPS